VTAERDPAARVGEPRRLHYTPRALYERATTSESESATAVSKPQTAPVAAAAIRADPHPSARIALAYFVYDAAWLLVLLLASPWLVWRSFRDATFADTLLARSGWRAIPSVPKRRGRRVLVHGVSVGEVKCAEVLVRALRKARPELEIVIASSTKTGAALARKLYPDLSVVRFPFDVSFVVRRFLERVDPTSVVLVELEVWPSFLRAANRRGSPVVVVNGRITERSAARYRCIEKIAPQFTRLTSVGAQDEAHAARFRALVGVAERVRVTGNLKYDALRDAPVSVTPALRALLVPERGARVLVAGSTHAPEEMIVARAWRTLERDVRLVIVPRHVERASDIARDLESIDAGPPIRAQLLSRLRAGEPPDPSQPVIVDSIGELEAIYSLADVVFVGGSLTSRGGQNVLEPAAQAKPVIHGPRMQNFAREAELLAAAGASVCVPDGEALARAVLRLLADPDERSRMGEAGRAAVARVKGASVRTLAALSELEL
jgi:3-deoxy-D-manno-octulosonic-acid transferase